MHSTLLLLASRRPARGFTLVEIMIVVVIIGLLAALAIPALQRVQRATRDNRFLSDLRTLAQAFETYSLKNGAWPPNAGNGVVPAGMSGELRDSFWQQKNSLGGTWNWDFNNNGFTAGISIVNVTVDDDEMQAIDAKIDDGDLSTGMFRKVSANRFRYILQ
jgi:type IV pilus assembly protein PilA